MGLEEAFKQIVKPGPEVEPTWIPELWAEQMGLDIGDLSPIGISAVGCFFANRKLPVQPLPLGVVVNNVRIGVRTMTDASKYKQLIVNVKDFEYAVHYGEIPAYFIAVKAGAEAGRFYGKVLGYVKITDLINYRLIGQLRGPALTEGKKAVFEEGGKKFTKEDTICLDIRFLSTDWDDLIKRLS